MANQKAQQLDQLMSQYTAAQASASFDVKGRKAALRKLESISGNRVAVYYSPRRGLSRSDVGPFGHMIKRVGTVPNLDLVIASPGGDGTAAETMVDLLRKYCTGKLRVVVPAYAKSAATLVALSADEIVMGESSELGPIDAQIDVMQDGVRQQVSAEHVLRARDTAVKELGSGDQARMMAAQIQLSTLSAPFLQFCQDAMDFAKDFAGKQLRKHMFQSEYAADGAKWDGVIDGLTKNLMSSSTHLTHGRMITAQDILNHSDLNSLRVNELAADDPYWLAASELYLRTEIVAEANELGKILYATGFQMFSG